MIRIAMLTLAFTAGAVLIQPVLAQGVPSLPIPGTGTLSPGQGAPPPPTKKLPNGECVAPNANGYASIRNFIPFYSFEDCIKSGGRPAKPLPGMAPKAK